jgi:hypothetical protein
MITLDQWARQYGISFMQLHALKVHVLGLDHPETLVQPPAQSEAAVQAGLRLAASKRGDRLWRNNVGALLDERGIPVRYGLANDSKRMNDHIKSSDVIGIEHGTGRFLSFECKEAGWRFTGTEREQAQLRWIGLINSLGGRAAFVTNPSQVYE